MSPRDLILKQALTLPPADQAFVARQLEDSLALLIAPETAQPDGTDSGELLAELQRRSKSYRRGTSTSRDVHDLLDDLRRRQSDEISP